MGWFAAAAMIGFVLFQGWNRNSLLLLVIPAGLAIGIVTWALIPAHGQHLGYIIDRLGSGSVARILLGLVLGFGGGFVIQRRLVVAFTASDWSAALLLALGITILAITAPYLDDWLPRITSIKSSVLELQVRAQTAHNIAVADNMETSSSAAVFKTFSSYPRVINDDIEYMTTIEQNELEYRLKSDSTNPALQIDHQKLMQRIKKSEELQEIFSKLIGPISNCLWDVQRGQYSIERLRQKVTPLADLLEQIVLIKPNDDERHHQFWSQLAQLPDWAMKIGLGKTDHCKEAKAASPSPPRIADYEDVPYLYVASMLFTHFLRDDGIALGILEKYKDNTRPDYTYWKFLAKLRYYQGRDTGSVINPFNKWRKEVLEHRERIAAHCSVIGSCPPEIKQRLEDLDLRERKAELVMMNNYAYFVAEDLARGVVGAAAFSATAEDYAEQIKDAIDAKGNLMESEENKKAVGDNKDDFLDTYAYTMLVLEARKIVPDVDVFRNMAHVLQRVVEHCEQKYQRSQDEFDLAELKIARIHHAAARDLAGE